LVVVLAGDFFGGILYKNRYKSRSTIDKPQYFKNMR
jgi:hypothetical protein